MLENETLSLGDLENLVNISDCDELIIIYESCVSKDLKKIEKYLKNILEKHVIQK